MNGSLDAPLIVVVGSGGVGKTTLAAALGLQSAVRGTDTLVMTFDPSRRLKDTLGVGERAADRPAKVAARTAGRLEASLLDARATFDRLVARHAPDRAAAERITANRFYRQLSGTLAGILEYMAVERLFEVAEEGRYGRVILDTPPTRQALDFLQAPERLVAFLDSGALNVALKPWFDDRGRLRAGKLRIVGRPLEKLLDRLVGLGLLRDIAEFFQAFGPLYDGFRARALEVQRLLRSERTRFVLVSGPGAERVADTLYFARKLREAGCRLGPVIVNQVLTVGRHQDAKTPRMDEAIEEGLRLYAALGERDRRGLAELRALLPGDRVVALPLLAQAPTDLASLSAFADALVAALASPD